MRSQRAQFMMVTLRKVSLTLADHHIGITHAGDGRSRLISEFDRAAAIEMGEEFEAERKSQAEAKAEREAMPELPDPEGMPRAPEPLGTPKSLGGLAERAGVETLEGDAEEGIEAGDGTLGSLRDRTDDWTEDMEERETIEQTPEEPAVTESEAEAEQKEAE
jgi:chromosome segregation protein